MCPGLPLLIVPLITFPAVIETTPRFVGEQPTNAVSKLKPPVFVSNRHTNPCCHIVFSQFISLPFVLLFYFVKLCTTYVLVLHCGFFISSPNSQSCSSEHEAECLQSGLTEGLRSFQLNRQRGYRGGWKVASSNPLSVTSTFRWKR